MRSAPSLFHGILGRNTPQNFNIRLYVQKRLATNRGTGSLVRLEGVLCTQFVVQLLVGLGCLIYCYIVQPNGMQPACME